MVCHTGDKIPAHASPATSKAERLAIAGIGTTEGGVMPRHCFNCKHYDTVEVEYIEDWNPGCDKETELIRAWKKKHNRTPKFEKEIKHILRGHDDGADGAPCPDWEGIA